MFTYVRIDDTLKTTLLSFTLLSFTQMTTYYLSYIQGVCFIFCIFKRLSFSHPWPNFLFLSGISSWDLKILHITSIWLKSIHNMPWSTPEKMCLFLDKNLGIFNMCWNIMSDTDQTFYCWYTQIGHCYLYICQVFELFCA